jgi:phosphohistidine phosphatase SixA
VVSESHTVLRRAWRTLAVLAIAITATAPAAAQNTEEAWAALVTGGHVALIRHATAPAGSGGDPPGVKSDDCATQRSLTEKGRAQARALGDAFRAHRVRVDEIYASPWCRCMNTARLTALGRVEGSWALVPATSSNLERLSALKALVSDWRGPGTLVLVTHGLTVQRLLGFVPDQAETVVVEPTPGTGSGVRVVGKIAAPQ